MSATSTSFTGSFGIQIVIDLTQVLALQTYTKTLVDNATKKVPQAIVTLLNSARSTAASITHQQKGVLASGWKVQVSFNMFSLVNDVPYAQKEFTRGGEKIRGRPPYGPHNVVPPIVDLISSNLEKVVMDALSSGVRR